MAKQTDQATEEPQAAAAEEPEAAAEESQVATEGEASAEQIKEMEEGNFVTVKELANQLKYSPAWISEMLCEGRIKGIKPTGGTWRIPASEAERIRKSGIPPLARAQTKEPPGEVVVEQEHMARVKDEPAERKEESGEEKKEAGKDPGWPLNLFLRDK